MNPKPRKGATRSKLQKQVADGYAAFCKRRGLKQSVKWTKKPHSQERKTK